MGILDLVRSELGYAKDLVDAGLAACDSVHRQSANMALPTLSGLANDAWMPAAVGASVGALTMLLSTRKRSTGSAVLFGVIGGVVGFGSALAWGSRGWTEAVARSAAEKVHVVRDAHWLERHPINYA